MKTAKQISKVVGQFHNVDVELVAKIINGKSNAIELMDYIAMECGLSERDWDRLVNRPIATSTDPANKFKMLRAIATVLRRRAAQEDRCAPPM